MSLIYRDDIRNIAIIAHVDHGKTTLVDHMLRQAGVFRANQKVEDRVMDSGDLEKERGITIMAKNVSVTWKDVKINIVDTPGHSDFGGEVERVLSMVDGVVLLVDSAEGPLPQTRFVLKKALELNLPPIVVINKIDRQDARPKEVLDEILELFINLGADYDMLNFPVLYAISKFGQSKVNLEDEWSDLEPLFDTILRVVPKPQHDIEGSFQMIVASLDWSDYIGRIAIGRIERGKIKVGDNVALMKRDGSMETQRITKLFTFRNMDRVDTEGAEAGDIMALSGFEKVDIGDTIADAQNPEKLDYVNIEEPTIAMYFMVNTSPFAGTDGKFVTTPKIRERLYKELRANVAMRVSDTDQPDVFKVSGRGELQLAILIETMRREGFEFAVSKPEVLFKRDEDGTQLEPIEHVVVDVPEKHIGTVIEILGRRKGEMINMTPISDSIRAEFKVPARGLIGFRTEFLTSTRGEGIIHQTFDSYQPFKGYMPGRTRGALVAMEQGSATAYAIESVQERGLLFIEPQDKIYEGMIVGINSREEDMSVNPTKMKQLTNMRASGSDGSPKLNTPLKMSLEQSIEFINDDELLEVTPVNIRIRKKILDTNLRIRAKKRAASDQ